MLCVLLVKRVCSVVHIASRHKHVSGRREMLQALPLRPRITFYGKAVFVQPKFSIRRVSWASGVSTSMAVVHFRLRILDEGSVQETSAQSHLLLSSLAIGPHANRSPFTYTNTLNATTSDG